MGTQEGDRDWVDVANDLLSKCHLNLKLRKLTDCGANVFITFYESIFGEKVPDYIAAPSSQEDDVHNVQSVIDSLSLDYLQISLSHITGENVVRGDKDAIKNLLEIFDGLLEYLNEEISEESQNGAEQNGSLGEEAPRVSAEPESHDATEQEENKAQAESLSSSGDSAVRSSKPSLHSCNGAELGSGSENLELGVSARTFTGEQAGVAAPPAASGPGTSEPQEPSLTEPLYSAVPLQPPSQCNTPHTHTAQPPGLPHPAATLAEEEEKEEEEEEAVPDTTESTSAAAETVVANGTVSPPPHQSPAPSEPSVSAEPRAGTGEEEEALQPRNGGPRRVLFRTQPDVLILSLREEPGTAGPSERGDGEEDERGGEDLHCAPKQHKRRTTPRGRERHGSKKEDEDEEEPLTSRRQKNRRAEKELHHISEKLSLRLEVLDQMLKRVLSESGESSEGREEEEDSKQSHHSDSIMECGRTPRQHTGTPEPGSGQRTRSLSPSPPPRARRSLQGQLDGAEAPAAAITAGDHTRREETHQRARSRQRAQVNKAYEEELQKYEDRERAELHKARLKAQEAEREYREAILRDVPQARTPSPAKIAAQHRSHRSKQTAAGRRRQGPPRKPSPMKLKENELLPVLLDELPHLHISPQALGRMWEQQLQQVDRLHAASTHKHQRRDKLSAEVEEAHRRHDLLVEIIRKEHEHKRRLKDFKERIQEQKSAQSRLRDQRQQIARAKKYYNDFHVHHRARVMRARTKEEKMFRQLFEEGLEVQKARVREERAHAKEQRLQHQRRHEDHIKSVENYYKDQFSLLSERLAQERQEIKVRTKAQEKALLKMKRELRSKMEHEIGELQKIIIQNNEDDYIQELEVRRLQGRVHMASFQYNTSCLH
ncbi:centrosomal protein of 95 kDa-like isoform X3 [Genypterus blacodes]|uniref:centrosomal protein of 95 kDa-like isoform X3 n=1 Tax=Genypterus blacodes TaxID=154954 RepID=UPI003F76C1AA